VIFLGSAAASAAVRRASRRTFAAWQSSNGGSILSARVNREGAVHCARGGRAPLSFASFQLKACDKSRDFFCPPFLLLVLRFFVCGQLTLPPTPLHLSYFTVGSHNLLLGESKARWNLGAAKTTLRETPVIDRSLTLWTFVGHSVVVL